MAEINWTGIVTKIVDLGSESTEQRMKKMILFAGAVGLGLIIIWKLWR